MGPEVEQFLEYLGGIEDQVFKHRLQNEAKRRAELQQLREGEGDFDGKGGGKGKDGKGKGKKGQQMGADLAQAPAKKPKAAPKAVEASDKQAWHAQLLAHSFSMDLDNLEAPPAEVPGTEVKEEDGAEKKLADKKQTGKFVDREFYSALKDR